MSWLVTNKRSFLHEQAVMFILMGMMVFIFILQWVTPYHWQLAYTTIPADMVESLEQIRSGNIGLSQLWPLVGMVTYAFLHGDLGHLGGNLLFFWIFGALINGLLGWRWLLATVLLTAFAGAATHNAMNHESWAPLWGASGIVSGFMGSYLGLATRWHLPDPHIWPIARPIPPANLVILAVFFVALDYQAIFSGAGGFTAYGAHVGGFTMGLFLACFIKPRPAEAGVRR